MPRVLRIINRLNLGGPTYNAAYLTAHLAPEFETMLVAGMKDESEESSEFILNSMGIKPVYIRNMEREINFRKDRDAYLQLSKIIKEFKPDIVHTHAAKAGTIGRIAAHRNKVPVILHTFHGHVFHSYFGPLKTRLFIEIERYLARLSTGIIAISEDQKKDLTETYRICSTEKTRVIPLGFDLDRFSNRQTELRAVFRKQYELDKDTLAIGIIGRLVPVKNHSLFIDAWKIVTEQYRGKIHAFIIGDGEDRRRIETHCKENNLLFNTPEEKTDNASLTFTSWIHDIERAMAGLDIIALSSNNEGTPVSLIEAQAAGKPIVSTKVGGLADAVLPGQTALLSAPGDTLSFANNLLRVLQDQELRENMAKMGPPFVHSRYTYRILVENMGRLYRELLKTKG